MMIVIGDAYVSNSNNNDNNDNDNDNNINVHGKCCSNRNLFWQ